MEILSHLFAALGRLLLWVSSVLVLEEMTLGGLARLVLTIPFDSGESSNKRSGRQSGSGALNKDL
jgi:hypothetical protein